MDSPINAPDGYGPSPCCILVSIPFQKLAYKKTIGKKKEKKEERMKKKSEKLAAIDYACLVSNFPLYQSKGYKANLKLRKWYQSLVRQIYINWAEKNCYGKNETQ